MNIPAGKELPSHREKDIALSAVLVVGPQRTRAQQSLDALYAQTISDAIEVIVVDLSSEDFPELKTSGTVRTVYTKKPKTISYPKARVEGVMQAGSDIVAFIEDHCFASPTWAEHLVEAHKGPWAAVGYAFMNANPETYIGRSAMIIDYGLWMHPARRGTVKYLPDNNISYKREHLLRFIDHLEICFSPDFILHETFFKSKLPLFLESGAVASHQNFTYLSGLLKANHEMNRIMAANRAITQSWSNGRKIFYGLCALPVIPALKFIRFCMGLNKDRFPALAVIRALPVIFASYFWGAAGESLGYLFGHPPEWQEAFTRWELEADRLKAP